jgi:ketosteroid isomerase-like protein
MTADHTDPIELIKAFDAAINAGDVDLTLAFFSADGYIKSPMDSKIYAGKEQVRQWIENQVNKIHVVSRNHRLTGDTVVWEGRVTGELVKQMGLSSLDEIAEAIVRDGKVVSFSLIVIAANP